MDPNEIFIEFDEKYETILKKLKEIDDSLPTINKKFNYGTSGFRYNEKELDKVLFLVYF
jgi:hypothetical protein